jgi:hypothetical protein
MKLLRLLTLIALVCGLSLPARANSFHVQVLDPILYQIQDTGGTFQFPFTDSCPITVSEPSGCIAVENDTDFTITGITLNFAAGNLPAFTGCDAPPFFTSANCPLTPDADGGYDLSFSGGTGIAAGDTFLIVETGVCVPADPTSTPPANDPCSIPADGPNPFGTVDASATFAATPEPSSFLLLGSGMMLAGAAVFGRRLLPGA